MGTKDFNPLDKFIARMRLGRVIHYIEKGDRVLDFGCGHQAYLLTHTKDIIRSGMGLDYDSESYKPAKNIEVINFHFKKLLPFKDKSFDKIFSLAVLEHLEPVVARHLMAEFHRVLVPGGKVILTTPTPWGKIILEFMAFRLGIISRAEVADHKKYYNKKDLADLAKRTGFRMEEYRTFQFGGNSICVLSG